MAKTEERIRGQIGNTVFYRVGRETRVRAAAASYSDANTAGQQAHRARLRVAVRFYQRLAGTPLREVWRQAARNSGRSGYNHFMKVNMMVFKPGGKIGDFSRLQLTVGLLQKVNLLAGEADGEDRVVLTWEPDVDLPTARRDDRLCVVVLYANRSFSPVFPDTGGAVRGDGRAEFRLERPRGTAAHVYCFFGEKEGKAYSTSQYIRF